MRPLRLLLSLCTTLTAITLLLYLVFGDQDEEEEQLRSAPTTGQKGKFNALFSFTSPGSLFPPSAIISLTDDNSTFFLARPAAFGPALPSNGLSGALWIGSGFGDDAMGRGELGCSDVPGWNEGNSHDDLPQLKTSIDSKTHSADTSHNGGDTSRPKDARNANDAGPRAPEQDDGTDDHLPGMLRAHDPKSSVHADIQSLQEGAEIAGKVVLLKRGGCGFLEKTKWAQKRGGVALIVGDDVRGGGLVRMYARGDTSNVSIPALFTSHTTAHLLSSLLPAGGLFQDLSPEDVAKFNLLENGKVGENGNADKSGQKKEKGTRLKSSPNLATTTQTGKSTGGNPVDIGSLLSFLGFGDRTKAISKDNSRRPPSSGKLGWGLGDEQQKSVKTRTMPGKSATTPSPGDFVIGEEDWRDTALLPQTAVASIPQAKNSYSEDTSKGDNALPSSGEYTTENTPESSRWFSKLFGGRRDVHPTIDTGYNGSGATSSTDAHAQDDDDLLGGLGTHVHKGLWVTLTPTNMSTSPFFDTLLVLVVSPLFTLTVVYALLILRSRIRRQRWRAPKSLVERLPIRTYHTISDSSPSATPNASSPSTPLLQHSPPQPPSSPPQPDPRTETHPEVPATSSSFLQPNRTPEEEKRESGLAAWRRRYGGRQRECVVCLEEYEDGISQVMSLPCGHEFHADCM
jgi:hypothetical protein